MDTCRVSRRSRWSSMCGLIVPALILRCSLCRRSVTASGKSLVGMSSGICITHATLTPSALRSQERTTPQSTSAMTCCSGASTQERCGALCASAICSYPGVALISMWGRIRAHHGREGVLERVGTIPLWTLSTLESRPLPTHGQPCESLSWASSQRMRPLTRSPRQSRQGVARQGASTPFKLFAI